MNKILWNPNKEIMQSSSMMKLGKDFGFVKDNETLDYGSLHDWSVNNLDAFWREVWKGNDVIGNFGAGHVIMRSAPPGTGIIAGGPMRAIFDSLGVKDIVAKSVGSTNPHNMIKATFNAFQNMASPKSVAAKRSKKISDIIVNTKKINKR